MNINRYRWVAAVLLAACVAGCGRSKHKVAPVSGTVTVDGVPVANALVGFEPSATQSDGLAGPGSYGRTDAAGRYELQTVKGRPGAVIGQHVVTISTQEMDEDEAGNPLEVTPELIPERFREFGALTFSVPAEGTSQADFALATGGGNPKE